MESGFYCAKIDAIMLIANGKSPYGEWSLFELTLSINLNGQRKVFRKVEFGSNLQNMYTDHSDQIRIDRKSYTQLKNKEILCYIDDE